MAKIEAVALVDDLDGGRADETIQFTIGGRTYEIDLSKANATRLREAFAPYIVAGRCRDTTDSGAAPHMPAPRSPMTAERRRNNTAVRVWARRHGYSVGDRGRIPATVLGAYERDAGRTAGPPAVRATSPHFQEAG
ncbi:Lsr2 family protein [Pseudonocardia sp. NPDC049635]|uniref:histone-like nucleoid-structuring protein Lsr2 n=1 Tax=Pseudonocardia sp. NPDC049635 TaxID=3155506 RepID=UPI0033E20034